MAPGDVPLSSPLRNRVAELEDHLHGQGSTFQPQRWDPREARGSPYAARSSVGSEALVFFEFRSDDQDQAAAFVSTTHPPARNDEITLGHLSPLERALFAKADVSEWENILRMSAVKVLSLARSTEIRRTAPTGIISSRMVRRWKT